MAVTRRDLYKARERRREFVLQDRLPPADWYDLWLEALDARRNEGLGTGRWPVSRCTPSSRIDWAILVSGRISDVLLEDFL